MTNHHISSCQVNNSRVFRNTVDINNIIRVRYNRQGQFVGTTTELCGRP